MSWPLFQDIPTPQPSERCKKIRSKNPEFGNKTIYTMTQPHDDETKLQLMDVCPPENSPGGWCPTHVPSSAEETFGQPAKGKIWGLCLKSFEEKPKCTFKQPHSHNRHPEPISGLNIFSEEFCDKETSFNSQNLAFLCILFSTLFKTVRITVFY